MSPEDRDRDIGVLAERVGRLERDQEEARKALDRFSARVDQQFEGLRALITSTVAGIRYVDANLYERDRASIEKGVIEAKADAERGIKIAWGIAVAFAVPFIGGLATIIIRAAS